MRQRSTLIILFGVAFLFIGGAIVYMLVSDDDGGSGGGDGEPTVSVYVASDDIPANTPGRDALAQGLLEVKEVPAASQGANAVTTPAALENAIFAIAVEDGTQIRSGQLATRSLSNVQIPEGMDGVAISVDYVSGGAGYIAPGDLVNVYGVYEVATTGNAGIDGATANLPRTELALTNVRVLDVSGQQSTTVQAAAGNEETQVNRGAGLSSVTYFLAVTPADAERLILLQQFASVHLGLPAEGNGNVGDTPGVDGTNVNAAPSAASSGLEDQ